MNTGMTLWFTGLSGAGKTTLSQRIALELRDRGLKVEELDGDVIRQFLSSGLGYSKEDRDTNIRRIGFVSRLLSRNGIIAVVAAISPYCAIRDEMRRKQGSARFIEIFVDCPLEVLIERDVKGLYRRAIRGEIQNFTGVSDPYEPPKHPEIHVRTDRESVEQSVAKIFAWLEQESCLERTSRLEKGLILQSSNAKS
jgi:adenylyl-sulfate kinase